MRVELLACDDPAWTAFLADVAHDFYHLPAYVALEAARDGGDAMALRVSDGDREVLVPLVLRPIPGETLRDAMSPYGFPGPLLRGTEDRTFIDVALSEAVQPLREAGIVSLFIRLHPLLDDPPPTCPGTLVRHGDTIALDATLSDEAAWSEMRGDHRNHINRAIRLGYRVDIGRNERDLPEFERLYAATMHRLSATDAYRYDEAYFAGLDAALGPRMQIVAARTGGDVVAGAGLLVETGDIVEYHLSASDGDYLRDGANKLMVHAVRAWARERGHRWVHMGGGVGAAEDSLFYFKVGFSQRRFRFHTLRVVTNDDAYARLVRAVDPRADPSDRHCYFPAYRSAAVTLDDGA